MAMTDASTQNRDREWLDKALAALDLVFFEGSLESAYVSIRWARWKKYKVEDDFVYATFNPQNHTIEVNRALAWHWVPDYEVMATIFHECLHYVVSIEHDVAFSLAEQRYPHYTAAALWELTPGNLKKLVDADKPF